MAGKKRALLFINRSKNETADLAGKLNAFLGQNGFETFSISPGEQPGEADFDIGISLGGDGSVLSAARTLAPLGVPILPINMGTLGFIASVHPENWEETFTAWRDGKAVVSKRLMLDVVAERSGKPVFTGPCINDVVISASGTAKLIRLEVETETAGGEHIPLGSFRSDGLIVATPTGSTGYSVAAGGPIIDPEMEALIINPICPFTLSNRPIVVPSDEKITALVETGQRRPVLLTLDGQISETLDPEDKVIIRQAPYRALLVSSDRDAFYRALRTKLGWSGGGRSRYI